MPPNAAKHLSKRLGDRVSKGKIADRVLLFIRQGDLLARAAKSAQNGIDKATRARGDQCHAFVDGGVVGNTVKIQELTKPQTQRLAHARLDPGGGQAGEGVDDMVQRDTMLGHTVKKCGKQGAVRTAEAASREGGIQGDIAILSRGLGTQQKL